MNVTEKQHRGIVGQLIIMLAVFLLAGAVGCTSGKGSGPGEGPGDEAPPVGAGGGDEAEQDGVRGGDEAPSIGAKNARDLGAIEEAQGALRRVSTELLRAHLPDRHQEFKGFKALTTNVYYRERMIGEALVMGDLEVYEVDNRDGSLLKTRREWRDDLPKVLPQVIGRDKVKALVEGEVVWALLIYLPREGSPALPQQPARTDGRAPNPCWLVQHRPEGSPVAKATVVDAVTGKIVGPAVAPPVNQGHTMNGPYSENCSNSWGSWYNNASYWFEQFGYTDGISPDHYTQPQENRMDYLVSSTRVKLLYLIAHGVQTYFANWCDPEGEYIPPFVTPYTYYYYMDVEDHLVEKKRFTFLGFCYGMAGSGDNNFSGAFRGHGSTTDTTVVGYIEMSEPQCASCWASSVGWQNTLFSWMNNGYRVYTGFVYANAAYPQCSECVRFAGDSSYVLPTY